MGKNQILATKPKAAVVYTAQNLEKKIQITT
jgi:hypothetical protein